MKKFLLLGAALAALTFPAMAEIQVKGILINQAAPKAEATNIRVNLANTGDQTVKVSSVQLQVRNSDSESWQTVKTFKNHLTMLAHKRMALDYLPARGESVNPILLQPEFQVRAVVNGYGTTLASSERPYVAHYQSLVMPR